jgi:hypothetical protein
MAQAPTPSTSSTSSSSTSSSSSSSSKLSTAAQAVVDKLQQSQSVFVSKDDLSEDDEDALEAAGFALEPDAVRDGYFVHVLSDTQKADQAAASA